MKEYVTIGCFENETASLFSIIFDVLCVTDINDVLMWNCKNTINNRSILYLKGEALLWFIVSIGVAIGHLLFGYIEMFGGKNFNHVLLCLWRKN